MSENAKINPAIIVLSVLLVIELTFFGQNETLVLTAPSPEVYLYAVELVCSLVAMVLIVVGLMGILGKSGLEGRKGTGIAKICLIIFLFQIIALVLNIAFNAA